MGANYRQLSQRLCVLQLFDELNLPDVLLELGARIKNLAIDHNQVRLIFYVALQFLYHLPLQRDPGHVPDL